MAAADPNLHARAAAFGIAVYMALYQWRVLGEVWEPVFGAQTKAVLDSDVSHRMGALSVYQTRL